MRYLLNTYVQADDATPQGGVGDTSLLELIVDSGIHDAIARKLNARGQLSQGAIAEAIINNVRKTIIREQLTDPRFYAQMSRLLDDLIAQSRSSAAAYADFLKNAEALARKLAAKQSVDDLPAALHGEPDVVAVIYRNLPAILGAGDGPRAADAMPGQRGWADLTLAVDRAMREQAPAGWRGDGARRYVNRESHDLWGRRYLLTVACADAKPAVKLDHRRITLTVRPGSTAEVRERVMHEWHKQLLHRAVPTLIARWEPRLGVRVNAFFLQRMKTKWGSANARAGHIRLNTELVKKPRDLLEYVVVHEMAHLIEPTHNARFVALMDAHWPGWREARAELNRLPLGADPRRGWPAACAGMSGLD